MNKQTRLSYVLSVLYCFMTSALYAEAWNGKTYSSNSSPQQSTAQLILETIDFVGDEHVLDLGCGSGNVTAFIAQQVPNGLVIGIDSSKSMIDSAQRHESSNLKFKHIHIQNCIFPENSFHFVMSFLCLHWIEDLKGILQKVEFILKPGGRLIGCMAHPQHFFYDPVIKVMQSSKWEPYFHNFSQEPWHSQDPNSFALLLDEVGLKPLSLSVWHKTAAFASKEQFANFIHNWIYAIPHMALLPIEKCEEFVKDMIEYFLANSEWVQMYQDESLTITGTVFSFEVIKQ